MLNRLQLHEDLAQVVLAGRDLNDVLNDITKVARRSVPAAESVSITLIRGERAFTAAYDAQMALDADEMQYERGYGPCLDAGWAGQIMLIDDMSTEQRWPDYTLNAAAHGIGSSLSVPLPFQSTTIGALNSYAGRPHAYGEDDVAVAEQVAAWIALAIGNAEAAARTSEELEHLRIAMQSRAVIEQAKGILIERHRVTEQQAFTLLAHASQRSNVKLRDVADELVRTGELRGTNRGLGAAPASTGGNGRADSGPG
jgi:GAF domain-containing protein